MSHYVWTAGLGKPGHTVTLPWATTPSTASSGDASTRGPVLGPCSHTTPTQPLTSFVTSGGDLTLLGLRVPVSRMGPTTAPTLRGVGRVEGADADLSRTGPDTDQVSTLFKPLVPR